MLFFCQRLTVKVITSPDEDLGPKEAHVLITMLAYLIPHLQDETEVGGSCVESSIYFESAF